MAEQMGLTFRHYCKASNAVVFVCFVLLLLVAAIAVAVAPFCCCCCCILAYGASVPNFMRSVVVNLVSHHGFTHDCLQECCLTWWWLLAPAAAVAPAVAAAVPAVLYF